MAEKLASPSESRKFTYIVQLYEAMVAESTKKIYEGKATETFHRLGISMAHYSELFRILKELGSIELLDRGARGRPTRYRMHVKPTAKAYDELYAGLLTKPEKPATIPLDEIEQRVKNLERRLEGVEVKQVLVNYEERISKLEKTKGGSKR